MDEYLEDFCSNDEENLIATAIVGNIPQNVKNDLINEGLLDPTED